MAHPLVVKLARYGAASVAGVITNQVVLTLTYGVAGWAVVPSNLLAVTCGAVPNYLINRYWTWSKKDRNRLMGEVLPFWGMSLLGMALSLFTTAWADERYGTTIAVSLASIAAFGVLWVAKFALLERVLFRTDPV